MKNSKRRVTTAMVALGIVSGALMGSGGSAEAVEVNPGHRPGQTDLLLNGEETARAASGDAWAAYSYCLNSGIIAQYGAVWGGVGGAAGALLAAPSLGTSLAAGAGVGGAGGAAGAAVGCTGLVIDAAREAKSQGKWAGLTFQPPGGGWTWTY